MRSYATVCAKVAVVWLLVTIIGNTISSCTFRVIKGLIRLFQQLVIMFQPTFKQFGCVKTADPDADGNGDWGRIDGNFADLAPQPLCQFIGVFG